MTSFNFRETVLYCLTQNFSNYKFINLFLLFWVQLSRCLLIAYEIFQEIVIDRNIVEDILLLKKSYPKKVDVGSNPIDFKMNDHNFWHYQSSTSSLFLFSRTIFSKIQMIFAFLVVFEKYHYDCVARIPSKIYINTHSNQDFSHV